MDEAKRKDIEARLLAAGHPAMGLTEKRWRQLDALYDAAQALLENRRKALEIMKKNEITVVNAERMLKELGGATMTDQTMRNGGGMLEAFLLSFKKDDVAFHDADKEVAELKQRLDHSRKELALMHQRDAECCDAVLKNEALLKRNEQLETDKKDLEWQLSQVRGGKSTSGRVVKMNAKKAKESS